MFMKVKSILKFWKKLSFLQLHGPMIIVVFFMDNIEISKERLMVQKR